MPFHHLFTLDVQAMTVIWWTSFGKLQLTYAFMPQGRQFCQARPLDAAYRGCRAPWRAGTSRDEIVLTSGTEIGALLVDGLGDGVAIECPSEDLEFLRLMCFGLLQARALPAVFPGALRCRSVLVWSTRMSRLGCAATGLLALATMAL